MMKYLLNLALFACLTMGCYAQKNKQDLTKPDPAKEIRTVEASCGQCQFHMKGKGCSLAIRINGKAYFVDGVGIDAFGDAHAKDGFCKSIRKAEVQGDIVKNRFHVTYFRLLQ